LTYKNNIFIRNFAWDFNAGLAGSDAQDSGVHRNKYCSLFEIQATLTEEGLQNLDEVIAIILGYMKFLRGSGLSRDFYRDHQRMRSVKFHALDQEINIDHLFPVNVSNLSLWLQQHDSRDLLTAPVLFRKFDEELLNACQDLMIPEKANFMLCTCPLDASFPEGTEVKTEEIFNTNYVAQGIFNLSLQSSISCVMVCLSFLRHYSGKIQRLVVRFFVTFHASTSQSIYSSGLLPCGSRISY
jgi:hypothetical protein